MHVFDGLATIIRFEGFKTLFSGGSITITRGALMTIGQLSMYDQIKQIILSQSHNAEILKDSVFTHITSSVFAATCATTLALPLDVCKTRLMNANEGTYQNNFQVAKSVYRELGALGFFRGFVPALVRLMPQTVLTFTFLEQLRINFGVTIYSK